jgi:hypothetical protein
MAAADDSVIGHFETNRLYQPKQNDTLKNSDTILILKRVTPPQKCWRDQR